MATETWSDSTIIKLYHSYPYAMTTTNCQNNQQRWTGYYEKGNPHSAVTSYRGDVQEIMVGSKKRKVFHPFERIMIKFTPKKSNEWHCGTGGNYWYESHCLDSWAWDTRFYPLTGPRHISGDICTFVNQSAIAEFASNIRKFVERDLVAKANAPDFDGAVFLAELDETVREIYRILKAPLEMLAVSQAKKKRPFLQRKTGIANLLLNPEEVWLWFRYFLMPAMMDAEDLIEASKGFMKVDRVQAGDRSEGLVKDAGSCVHNYANSLPADINWSTEYKYGAGGAIDIHSRFDPNRWGTSAWDVLRAGWERTPWSFVFDWVVNVGDWLASLREIELQVAQSYATIAIEAETKVRLEQSRGWHTDQDEVTYNTLYISRIIDIDPPTFPLVDKRWNNILRTVDLISLVLTTVKRLSRR